MSHRIRIAGSGLWISKPGKSALSSDPDDFLVDTSALNARYVHQELITSLSQVGSGSQYEYVYTHNLGYIPMFFVVDQSPLIASGGGGNPSFAWCTGVADSTTVKVHRSYIGNPPLPSTLTVSCRLSVFADRWV